MKRETYVSIPQPCHENWDDMTPQDKGRFCAGCAKTVVDFSQMSDTQILHFLSQSKGRVCGRFAQDQVERPLIPIKKEKKKIWWIAALMPLTLLLNRANGQRSIHKANNIEYNKCERSMGLVAVGTHKVKDTMQVSKTITGTVTDEQNNPVLGAAVTCLETKEGVVTDSDGKFHFELTAQDSSVTITITYIGYEEKEIHYNFKDDDNLNINLQTLTLTPVVTGVVVIAGGISMYHPVKQLDTIKTTVRKIFKANPFKVYPNPVFRGAEVNIELKKEGHYSVQLLNLHSKLITQNVVDAVQGATKTSLTIPSSITPGMYFIRLVNDDANQQHTEKIIVQ